MNLPVLLVDDNAANRQILLEITKSWGMNPTAVESGCAAIEAIHQAEASGSGFRMAIIDSHMPQMDGFQLAEQIKQNLRLAGTIVMMMTSDDRRGKGERRSGMGIAAYLQKPIRQSELLSAILIVLGQTSPGSGPGSVTRYSPPKTSIKLRILVAEDNPVNQRVVVRMLEKMGHLPEIAHNGREALSMLEAGTFDLVFMDVQMPEIGGLTATRKIRENEMQTGNHIPIIAMTAHAMKGDKERCLEAGMDAYISKPVTGQGIAETIAEVFHVEAQAHVISASPLLPDAPAMWDRSKALERVDGDEPLLRELVQIFLKESPLQLASLQQAIETANLEEIERIARTLNGELGYLGMADAAQKAKDLEHLGHERTLQLAADLFPTFEAGVSAVAAAMQDMLDERREPVDL